ncbi:amino acid adenylation domain-containing protein [Streptomyces sp. NPDC059134]|uniref:amino acid adenylation domain-containing protein n=1 Tax=Streptomyces sp. NPDC059134 TaxID=3346738 RepID=UPI0036C295AC
MSPSSAVPAAARVAWHGPSRRIPPATLPELFEAQAAATPDRTALVFEGSRTRYDRLDADANRLAHLLLERGVRPGDRVAVAVPRSVELVVALLAVVKSGAAYVPVDPDHPRDRVRRLLCDAAPRVVLTTTPVAEVVDTPDGAVLLDDPRTAASLAALPSSSPTAADLGTAPTPGRPAYVIYTSGSTGHPKGVVVPHHAVVNRLLWMQHTYRLEADDRVLQKTPAGFDVSVWEFFWPLITGATLVIARPGGHKDPGHLVHLIRSEGVTTVHFVPSMLRYFLQAPGAAGCHSLRRVFCSGEALPADLVEPCLRTLGADLHNLYGPTEATVDVTHWPCLPGGDPSVTVPIGRPVWNTSAYVLDGALRPVEDGGIGELYLAGAQLAHGYLGKPGLTAGSFVPDPFGAPGARMYRTGDLAARHPEGHLLFHGRADHQVKVRGFRIEPAEIEAALTARPDVGQAVVVLREDRPGDPRLVAYVTPAPGATRPDATGPDVTGPEGPDTALLRDALTARLPDYMVPAAFVTLDELPLTPNGKLDRRALPAPGNPAPARTGREPRTPVERTLCALAAEALGTEGLTIDDNFFHLGGNSLLAVRYAAGIHTALGTPIEDVRVFFEAPTVAELSVRLFPPADEDTEESRTHTPSGGARPRPR